MNSPKISVILPIFNGEDHVAEALASIAAQSMVPLETVVVDDGSTDKSVDAVLAFSSRLAIVLVRQKHAGAAAARNEALRVAKGELIAFLDADDAWLPTKLATQAQHLVDHPEIDLVLTGVEHFWDPESPPSEDVVTQFVSERIGVMTMMCRARCFADVGTFDTGYGVGSDFDWCVRARQSAMGMTILPEALVRRRIHANNLSSDLTTRKRAMTGLLRAAIKRANEKKGSDAT